MMEAAAVVERVEGERAWVRLSGRPGGCGRCDEPGGCRSTGIAYALKAPNDVFALPNTIGAQPGEAVRLRMQDGAALRGALLGYGLGVLLALAGAAGGTAFAEPARADLFASVGALAGLAGAMALNRFVFRSRTLRRGFQIEMLRGGVACDAESSESQ